MSVNKLNMDAKSSNSDVYWFGLDDLSAGRHARRIHFDEVVNLQTVARDLNLSWAKPVLMGIYNYDEIIDKCNEIFKYYKEEHGQIIEGIVIRTHYSNNLSVKLINGEYDARS